MPLQHLVQNGKRPLDDDSGVCQPATADITAGLIPLVGIDEAHAASESVLMFACVAAASYIWTFIAGATSRGAVVAKAVVERRSSAIPQAIFASTFAVHGAMRNTSHS